LLNCQLLEQVCAMLHHSQLSKNLWEEAIQFIVWLKNHTTTWALGKITPYKQLHGSKPNLRGGPEWGQHVWVHQASGSKLDRHGAEEWWVCFNSNSTYTHCIYWEGKNSVSVECNIKPPSAIATISLDPPALVSLTLPTVITLQPLTMTTQQAAAMLPTPPCSVIINAPIPPTTTPMTILVPVHCH